MPAKKAEKLQKSPSHSKKFLKKEDLVKSKLVKGSKPGQEKRTDEGKKRHWQGRIHHIQYGAEVEAKTGMPKRQRRVGQMESSNQRKGP